MFLEKSQRNLVMYALQKRLLLCPPEKKQARSFETKKKKNEKCYKASLSEREKLISSGITSDFQHLLSSAGTRRVSEPKKGYFQSISDCLILMTHNKPQSQKNRSKLNCLWNRTLTWIDINIHVYVNERRRRQCWKLPFQLKMWKRTFYFLLLGSTKRGLCWYLRSDGPSSDLPARSCADDVRRRPLESSLSSIRRLHSEPRFDRPCRCHSDFNRGWWRSSVCAWEASRSPSPFGLRRK